MPVHDWTRVDAGIFHAFHLGWTAHLSEALNAGVLPEGYYSLPEQVAGPLGPDVLTLRVPASSGGNGAASAPAVGGGVAMLTPPRARFTARLDPMTYPHRQRHAAIRHVSDHRIVAIIEVVSPSNKGAEAEMGSFRDKVILALQRGIHFLVLDLHPPTPRDPRGVHGVIAEACGAEPFIPPAGQDRMMASYLATRPVEAYLEPLAVGEPLPDMPLFLREGLHVQVPLEATYSRAYRGMPAIWRGVLEGA